MSTSDGYARPTKPRPPRTARPGMVPQSRSTAPVDHEPRCDGAHPVKGTCGRMLARMLTRPWVVDCPKCGHRNERS